MRTESRNSKIRGGSPPEVRKQVSRGLRTVWCVFQLVIYQKGRGKRQTNKQTSRDMNTYGYMDTDADTALTGDGERVISRYLFPLGWERDERVEKEVNT